MNARRVVTGDRGGGSSRVIADEPAPHVTALDDYPGLTIEHFWSTNGPGPLDTSGEETTGPDDGVFPPPGGTRFVRISYPPGFGTAAPDDASASALERMLVHRSATIDYGVVVDGEMTLVLEDGLETVLRNGDVVVQNGTMHGWRNTTGHAAVVVFVLVGCEV